jgi:signal peptidase I
MKLADKLLDDARELVRTVAVVAPIYLALTTVAYGAYSIPSESMTPTLEVNDRVVVSKFAYGYSRYDLPLGLDRVLPASQTRLFERAPERGDVVVFMHPRERKVMIKRLIGLPGDTVAVRNGVLTINGEAVSRSGGESLVRAAHEAGLQNVVRYREALPGGRSHLIDEFSDDGTFDNYGPVVVPPSHFFAMGDNRDNSLDSRWEGMGMTPMENLIGRAERIYFTMPRLGGPPGVAPPRERLFKQP